jgi:hypothetical protein
MLPPDRTRPRDPAGKYKEVAMRKLKFAIDYIKQRNGEDYAKLRFKGIFPELRFKVDSIDGEFSLNDLKERIKTEGFNKGDKLTLTITNTETGQKQETVIDFSKNWPADLPEHPDQSREGALEIEV